MERLKKRKKTQFELDLRARFLVGIWAGIVIGMTIGAITGALVVRHNVVASDIQDIKAEIRITVKEMKLERIEMDKLVQAIQGWQMEIDEIWLYYGTSRPLRTRMMISEEGRPSKED